MAIRIILRGRDGEIGLTLKNELEKGAKRVETAVTGTMNDVAKEIKDRGDEDIQAAGNFGQRWLDSLHVDTEQSGTHATVKVFHTIPYAWVFEKGATIQGKPTMWLPLGGASAGGSPLQAKGYPGGLFKVFPKSGGHPLLGSIQTGEILFVGLDQVTLRKRFSLKEICADVASKLGEIFKKNFLNG